MADEPLNKEVKDLMIEASNLHKSGKLEELENVLRKIVDIDNNYYPALFNIARLLEIKKNILEAIKFYKKVIEINSNHLESFVNLANCYEDINEMEEAVKVLEKACKLFPDNHEVYYSSARLCHQRNIDIEKALNYYKKTLSINSDFVLAQHGLGQIYKIKGDFNEAKEIFKKIIHSNPNNMSACYDITDILNEDEINKDIKRLKLIDIKNLNDINKIFFYLSMAKRYEIIKNYEKSFYYYDLGNNLKKKYSNFSIDNENDRFDVVKKITEKFKFNIKKNIGNKSSKPIFIIGMPRSGTTLVEQIISSHSKVEGGGEFCNFTDFFQKLNPERNKNLYEVLKSLTEKNISDVGKMYLDTIEKISNKKDYFTNKMPGNFINIGLIKLCLPNAKIIHCKRNAVDTCLSCYKTYFTEGNTFTYSLSDLGDYYNFYKKQMKYYKEVFNQEILDIEYENIVSNIENETKKVLNFLNIDFEKSCLEFYKNKRLIHSASVTQVRKPIYKSSINSWNNYKKYLNPLTEKLNS